MEITIPYNFKPREYQLPLFEALDSGYLRAFCLWHRRSGKDLALWNYIIKRAFERVGTYYYFLPTYTQAKKVIWDGITIEGRSFLSYIPDECVVSKNGQEMKIMLTNGSQIQLIGTDNYDSIRGTNPIGCVFSEFAYQHPQAWEIVKPILKVNKGFAVFNTTPNGKNHSYDLHMVAENDPLWFCQVLSILDTKVLTKEDMEQERKEGMTPEMIAQEYYCSYEVGVLGGVYSDEMQEIRKRNGITAVPIMKGAVVNCYLDLGKNDSTAITFTQRLGMEIRVIDFFEDRLKGVDYYADILRKRGYNYGTIYLPHDAKHNRMESDKTIQQQFEDCGFKTVVIPVSDKINGIQQVRKLFPRMYFDEERCEILIKALDNYHYTYDEKAKVFRNDPKHDWSSHACDSIRYMAVGWEDEVFGVSHGVKIKKYSKRGPRRR